MINERSNLTKESQFMLMKFDDAQIYAVSSTQGHGTIMLKEGDVTEQCSKKENIKIDGK